MSYFEKGQQAAVSTPHAQPPQKHLPSQPSVARQAPAPTVTATGGTVAPVNSPTANRTERAVGASAPAVTSTGGAVDPAVQPHTAAPVASQMDSSGPVEQNSNNIYSVMEKQNEITALLNSVCLQCPRRRFMFLKVIHYNITLSSSHLNTSLKPKTQIPQIVSIIWNSTPEDNQGNL